MTTAMAWALVVMITAGGTSLVGNTVLCVGSDGHADLEVALGVCCLEADIPHDETDGYAPAGLVDSCSGCADLELDETPLKRQKHQLDPPHVAAMNEAVHTSACAAPLVDSGSSRGCLSPHLEVLATVVLLT